VRNGDTFESIQKATRYLFTAGSSGMKGKAKAEQSESQPKPNDDTIVDAEFTEVKDKA